ncbi:thiamine-phosphate kinase [Pseudomonas sp. M30-35]|uniref:thiamine-phosphate kinase n=1 Tax=Pseudomonas sp. M30-35 TaxID=1981174 RepID=UPI000B3D4C6D|nr:thiamine-phosphate kinase [Pseudomonas sp. M30-35]ARU87147.1 thiamine-phosphate kinase [Pseudomonas sp. M30-35]
MGEFELIGHYFASAACAQGGDGVVLGIGDDCALLEVPADEQLAISTDTLVAGVHFPHDPDPYLLAQRALAVTVSDLAAMGATPIGFTLALTLESANADWLQAFAQGLDQMARACSISLIGGDTTRGPLSLTLTVFGRTPKNLALTRSGAQVGDLLCVGGCLGNAAGALPLVLGQRSDDSGAAKALLQHYWSPQPQLALGQALRGNASAALDISDGLLADCGHIAAASRVRLQIELAKVPVSAALQAFADAETARNCALSGGDDYVLAFTLPAAKLAPLQAQGWPVHVIGSVQAGQGVELVDESGQRSLQAKGGYQHFAGSGD